jgi:hypothetical protein
MARMSDVKFGEGTKDKDKEDAFRAYAKAAGLEGAKFSKTEGSGAKRQFIYTDKEGNE